MAKAIKKTAKKPAKKSVRKTAGKVTKKAAPKKTSRPLKKSGKRFLIIYHAPIDAMAQTANASPEDMEKGMAMWKAWAKRAGSKLTDLGAPLVNGKRLHSNGSSAPSNRDVTGYSLLEADNWEELEDLLSGHPHISGWHPGATIEVHETMLIPGM
ncbi:MAG TPA: hypothetical protein VHQ04_06170 [Puia sp.]|nr:hypothetical protein [Puia sp.]